MSTVCIVYGFGEGRQVGKRFQKALRAAGHTPTRDAATADVIVTHSGGCLLLPPNIRAKQILHIAPYYWPGRSWVDSLGRKLVEDARTHHREGELKFWLRKTWWNFTYGWNMLKNFRMLRNIGSEARWHHGTITMVVRPRYDTFCAPDPAAMPFPQPPAFISFPGHHDDCWRDPKPYIQLIKNW